MERLNTLKSIDLSDLRLDAIEILALPGTRGSADFAASCGTNCNVATACSCTQPKTKAFVTE